MSQLHFYDHIPTPCHWFPTIEIQRIMPVLYVTLIDSIVCLAFLITVFSKKKSLVVILTIVAKYLKKVGT